MGSMRIFSELKDHLRKTPLSVFFLQGIVFIGIGWFAAFLFSTQLSPISSSTTKIPTRLAQSDYPLINPLLLCNIENNVNSVDTNLKQKITNLVDQRINSGAATNISVYLQEYGTGKWVGVNENDQYDPASLLKVPLMIAYYQIGEKNPSILKQEVAFNGTDQNDDEYFKSPNNIKSGKFYSVEELIKSMIVNSDNTAMLLLSNYVDKSSLYDVYTDLNLPLPPTDPTVEYISAKSYAYFFRILYNATYLSHSDSQKALDLLTEEHLPNGIYSAVSPDLKVADKFGERTVTDQNNNVIRRELHDCGIVYGTHSPYLLCIMSKGNDFDTLAKNIHDISAMVYDSIGK